MNRCFPLLLAVLFSFSAAAQSLFFKDYYLLKKNEQVNVNKILQDKTGFIWFATDKGLFKFDGHTYRRFLSLDNLPDENVTALAEDSVGRVWVGFKSGKISIVEKNSITPFEPAEGMPKLPISDILFARDGAMWFSTLNDGAYYYVNSRLYRLDDIDGMPDLFCYDLEEDTNGNIWIGTDGGVAVCDRTKNPIEIKVLNYSSGLPDNIVKKIVKGTKEMYLATEDAGAVRFDLEKSTFSSLIKGKWSYGSINDLLLTDNWLWLAGSRGLFTLDLAEKIPQAKIHSTEPTLSLSSDVEGNVWVGSKTAVQRTLGKQLQYIEPEANFNVIAVTVEKSGDIWFSNGKALVRRKSGVLTKPLVNTPFASKSVISLYTDDKGFIWAGLYGEGVLRIDPEKGSIQHFNKELRNGSVLSVSGKGSKIWLATLGGAIEIKTDANFSTTNYNTTNGLSTDYIYQVFVDSQDRVWFATDRDGVDMLDASGIHHFKDNFDSKVIYGFTEDNQHRVWANVQGLGLFVFDGSKFQQFEDQFRLHNSSINVFTSDNRGHLLGAHESGIDVINPEKKLFRYFDDQSGAGNRIPNLNAVAKDANGSILIGTNQGLIVYSSQSNKQESPKPHIDRVRIDDQYFDLTKTDRLSYDQNNLKIEFLGFWYQNPAALSFNFQLENYDPNWISSHDFSATYSKLPPGDYTFRLKASDSENFADLSEAELHFVIKPPFWRTNLFYIAVLALISFAGYSFVRLREKKLLADKRALEAKVRERTAEIEANTHEIQAQAEEIKGINENLEGLVMARTAELEQKNKALEEYAFINAHELRAPVASILGLINLMQKLDLKGEEKVYVEHLKESARKLDSVVSSITEAIERGDFGKPL
ncbi:hypothetical protein WSM22_26770 [Cytophagales bacterium WSM2-2]|nr:hypothetical protein WSM22_26770 [Cytophagales bacterium WSM2-2]